MLRLIRALSHLPLALLQVAGGVVGLLVYGLSARYRTSLRANLAQAGYPDLHWAAAWEAGRMLGELPWVWFRPDPTACVQVVGRDCVEQAQRDGRGVLFLTPHLGCFEVSAQVAAGWGPITVLYRPPHKRWLQPLAQARLRPNLGVAPATAAGMRPLLRALRAGEAVGLLPDQAPSAGDGVWAPFFGRPAYTMTLPARLAQLTGAVIVLACAERLGSGQGWRLRLTPLTATLPDDPVAAAAAVNAAIEELIRVRPAQYLWGYKRYKVPRGAPPPESAA